MAPVKRVAIIGAGAGGSSSAYHVQKYAKEAGIQANITIFERNSYIGGRSITVHPFDDPEETVELGASIFVKVNHILYNATEEFGLNKTTLRDDNLSTGGPALGIYDGTQFLFTQDTGSSWYWDIAKLIWRYGLAPIKTNNLMKDVVGKFLKMYDPPHFPFASLTAKTYELELHQATGMTGEQFLKENGIGDLFAREIVQASTRVNYAQNLPLIHGVETMVCMATDGAMSIQGGNWKIFDKMVHSTTKDVHLSTNVTSLLRNDDGTFTLTAAKTDDSDSATTSNFDTVILAAPYQFSNLKIKPLPQYIPDEISYVNLHVTLFTSPHYLTPKAFNLKADQQVPQIILTTLEPGENPGTKPVYPGKAGFYSISTLRRVKNPKTEKEEYLYKIFSPDRVDDKFLARILDIPTSTGAEGILKKEDLSWVYRKLWQSYPHEYPRVTFEELRLDENLWYTSGIESFISTMETSALMGRNVAKLIVDEWISKEKHPYFETNMRPDLAGSMQKPLVKGKL